MIGVVFLYTLYCRVKMVKNWKNGAEKDSNQPPWAQTDTAATTALPPLLWLSFSLHIYNLWIKKEGNLGPTEPCDCPLLPDAVRVWADFGPCNAWSSFEHFLLFTKILKIVYLSEFLCNSKNSDYNFIALLIMFSFHKYA